MSADAHSIRGALEEGMELVALGDDVRRRVHRLLTQDVKAIVALLREQDEIARALGGRLDELARVAQAAEHRPQEPNPLAVKAIARALRPALAVLADPHAHTAQQYVSATRDLRSITAQVAREKLLSKSVRIQLGPGRHDLLRRLLVDTHEAAA